MNGRRSGALTELLVSLAEDSRKLDSFREDPDALLDAAGITDARERGALVSGRSSAIGGLVIAHAAVPPPEEIEALVRGRAADDPAFVDRLRTEPRRTVERAIGVRLPRTFEVLVGAGPDEPGVTIRRTAPARPAVVEAVGVPPETPLASEHEAPLASEHEAPLASEHEAPLASEHEAPLASEHEAPLASEHEAPLASEHEAPLASEHEAPLASEHEAPLASEHEAPLASDDRPDAGAARRSNGLVGAAPVAHVRRPGYWQAKRQQWREDHARRIAATSVR